LLRQCSIVHHSEVSDFAEFTVGDCIVVVTVGQRNSWKEWPEAGVTDRSSTAGGKKGSSQLLPMKHCPFLTEER